MTEHEIKLAIADLQRTLREFCGYAPPREVDLLDYPQEPQHPHDDPMYKAMEALNFYAHNSAAVVADGGKIARETLAELSGIAGATAALADAADRLASNAMAMLANDGAAHE